MGILQGILGIRWELAAVMLAAMTAVIAAAAGIRAMLTGRRNELIARLERTIGRVQSAPRKREGTSTGALGRILQPIARLARPTKAAELSRLRLRLTQGGYREPAAVEIFLGIKLLLATVITLAFLQINARFVDRLEFPLDMAAAVWLCGGAFFLPNIFLASRIKNRQTEIERALPDAMDLLVTCVEAGLGLDAALARVAEEIGIASALLAVELNLTFLEVQAGVSRADAFRRLAERTGVEDLRSLSAVLIQTEMFGTSVARALRVHADSMRIKRMQRAEEKAAMVGVKMTIPLVLCILPSLIAILLGPAVVAIANGLLNK
jgi:tight adherence protein C